MGKKESGQTGKDTPDRGRIRGWVGWVKWRGGRSGFAAQVGLPQVGAACLGDFLGLRLPPFGDLAVVARALSCELVLPMPAQKIMASSSPTTPTGMWSMMKVMKM